MPCAALVALAGKLVLNVTQAGSGCKCHARINAWCAVLIVQVAGGCRCEFVPQMIFLNFLFGYLCLLMVIKWVSGSTADLYHIMIYMFLQPGEGGLTCDGGCMENRMFPGQGTIQARLLHTGVLGFRKGLHAMAAAR